VAREPEAHDIDTTDTDCGFGWWKVLEQNFHFRFPVPIVDCILVPMKGDHFCFQDFDTKDYTLDLQGRSITVTKEQFDDVTWKEIVRRAFQ